MTDRNEHRETDRILGALQANAKAQEKASDASAADRERIRQSIDALRNDLAPLKELPPRVAKLEATTATLQSESDERRGAARVTSAVYGAGGSGAMIALYSAGKWLAAWAGFLPR